MSAAKHTPGPWVQCAEGYPSPDVRAASGRAVAVTWMVCKSTPKSAEGFQSRQEEDRANARLIAAAPELLEALRMLMVGCDWKTLQGVEAWHNKQMPSDEALTAARAAIAKATGGQS